MSEHTAWYISRASGIVAWALLALAVVAGLLLSLKLSAKPTPRWLLDLHRFLGTLGITFTGLHMVALIADSWVDFDVADLIVPFASEWEPLPVALGVVAFWLLVAVQLSSRYAPRLPRNTWRAIHMSGYALFWLATLHGLTAGSDAGNVAYRIATNIAAGAVVFLTMVRALAPRQRRQVQTLRRSTP